MQKYKEVDYIRINGIDKWFDTGIKCKLALTIKAKVICRRTAGSWGPILGSGIDSDKPNFYRISIPNSSSERVVFDCCNENQRIKNNQITSLINVALEIVAKNGELTVNGKTTTATPFTSEFALDRNFVIGNNRNSSTNDTDCEYYYLQLFDGDDLVFDGIPCVDMDGTPAFYDKVTDRLIYAGGTSGTISHPTPHETFTYNVPKRADGTFKCTVVPSHTLDPLTFVYLNQATSSSISIPFPWNTARPDLKIRAKYRPKTSQNGGTTLGFRNLGDNKDFRFFAFSSSYAYFDYDSGRATVNGYGYNSGTKEIEIGNCYIKDLQTDKTVVNAKELITDCIYVSDGKAYFQFGYVYINYVQVLDKDDNLLLDLIPKKDANGKNCLYDKLTDTYYGADWGMTWSEEGLVESSWNRCRSVDFGGAEVEFSGQTGSKAPFSGNTSLTSVTNGTITNPQCYSFFKDCTSLATFDCDVTRVDWTETMFSGCTSLQSFDCQLPKASFCDNMFYGCSSLTSFNIDMPEASSCRYMFCNCSNLQSFRSKTPKLSTPIGMFQGCKNLTSVYIDVLNIHYADYIYSMFYSCSNLAYAEIVVKAANSGWTQADFSIPSEAPCQLYKYVDDLGDGTVRLVFTNEERIKYKITIGSDSQDALNAIVIAEDAENNNTNLTI